MILIDSVEGVQAHEAMKIAGPYRTANANSPTFRIVQRQVNTWFFDLQIFLLDEAPQATFKRVG